ncbi:MAG: hypothetical protein HY646_08660, partial [Acidobacteria bacterium]|nr:hypothetical protein [Acidobacteriota bacterium]
MPTPGSSFRCSAFLVIVMLACAATVFAQVSTVVPLAGSSGQPGGLDGVGSAARFDYPQSVWSDGTYIYVADTGNDAIRRITIATGTVTTIAGSVGVTGAVDATGTAARFRGPEGIWGDGTNLYVADTLNHTVRRIALATGAVTTLAGASGNSGAVDGAGTAARFDSPRGLWGDGTNLYVADYGNHSIRRIVLSSGAVTTIAGLAATPAGT